MADKYELHYHPDGLVIVRTPAVIYADKAENFALDYGSPFPAMTDGAVERVYTRGVRHALMADGNVVAGGPDPWAEGDAIIDAVNAIVQSRYDRCNPPVTLDQVKASKVAALRSSCLSQITGGFTSSALGAAHTYPSNATDQQNMIASVTASLLPSLPVDWTTPFWCADQNGNWTFAAHTVAQIQQVGLDGKVMVLAAQEKLASLAAQVTGAADANAVAAIVWA